MVMFRTIIIFFVLAFSFLPAGSNARTFEKINLTDTVSRALNQVLLQASLLQDAFYRQSDQEIETYLRELVQTIDGARRIAKNEKIHGLHLNRVLETALGHFSGLMRTVGEERTKGLRLGYEQVVLIAQTYRLDNYKIFYCGKNDTIWLQKNSKVQNPFNPSTYGTCGVPIR